MQIVRKPEEPVKIVLNKAMIPMQIFANIAELNFNYIDNVGFYSQHSFCREFC